MPDNGPSDVKLKGRQAALAVVSKLRAPQPEPAPAEPVEQPPIQLTGLEQVTEAIEKIASRELDLSDITAQIAALVDSNEPFDTSDIVSAIEALKLESNLTVDFSPVIEAIDRLSIDLSPLQKQLDNITSAVNDNTSAIMDLVEVAKSPKEVVYDSMGRVIEIKIKL